MKKIISLLLVLFTLGFSAYADDKPITQEQLPAPAQQFIKKYFPAAKIAYATVAKDLLGKDYKVRLDDMTKLEFDGSGQWTEVDCGRNAVPAAIVPKPIADHVGKSFKGVPVVKIERDRKGYDVELQNKLEIKFDSKFNVLEYDD